MKPLGAYTENSLHIKPPLYCTTDSYNNFSKTHSLTSWNDLTLFEYEDRTRYNSGPGWQRKAALGLLPPTPSALQSVKLLEASPNRIRQLVSNGGYTEASGYFGIPNVIPLTTLDSIFGTDDRDYAVEKAKSRLISKFGDIQANTGVMIGEANQTKLLLGDMSKDLLHKTDQWAAKSVKELQRQYRLSNKSLTAFTNLCDTASSLYLAFIYGVQPLVTDIGNLYDVCTTERNRCLRTKFKGTYKRKLSCTVDEALMAPSLSGRPLGRKTHYTRTIEAHAGCSLKSTPNTYGDPQARLGLLTSNIIPTIYEIIPYSFVLDMFSNIGDMIGSYSYPVPSYSDAWSVLLVEDLIEISFSLLPVNGVWKQEGSGGSATAKAVYYSRQPVASIQPNLVFTSWDSLSPSGRFNLEALATNILSKYAHGWARGLNLPKSWPKPTVSSNFSLVEVPL